MTLTLASYNIHRCYGRDGRHDPARIREVLRRTQADVIALQEVELLRDEPGLLDYLCEDSPWTAIHGPTLAGGHADYGNALLVSPPTASIDRIDISQPGREPRGAIDVTLRLPDTTLRVLATHLGLRPSERRAQVQELLAVLRRSPQSLNSGHAAVLMGDLNEWFLWGRLLRRLKAYFEPAFSPATFPARFPVFALDQIWCSAPARLTKVRALRSPLARVASDHLPLIAELQTPHAPS